MRNHDYAKARNPLTTRGTFDGETKGRSDGQTVRRSDGNAPTIREVLYVRPDGLAAAVCLNQEIGMTEIVWTVKNPLTPGYWKARCRKKPRSLKKEKSS